MFGRYVGRMFAMLAMAAALFVVTPVDEAKAQATTTFGRDEIGRSKRLGIGLEGGYPYGGFTLKYYLSQNSALQATLGGLYYYGLGLKGQYVIHPAILVQAPGITIPFYAGVGVGVGISGYGFGLNPHGVVGLAFQLRMIPLDFYLQLEPGFIFGNYLYSGNFAFVPGGASGVRWYF